MVHKFKSGDKVKIIALQNPRRWYANRMDEIFVLDKPLEFSLEAAWKLVGEGPRYVYENNIELVEEEMKPLTEKVRKFKCINGEGWSLYFTQGKEYTLLKEDAYSLYFIDDLGNEQRIMVYWQDFQEVFEQELKFPKVFYVRHTGGHSTFMKIEYNEEADAWGSGDDNRFPWTEKDVEFHLGEGNNWELISEEEYLKHTTEPNVLHAIQLYLQQLKYAKPYVSIEAKYILVIDDYGNEHYISTLAEAYDVIDALETLAKYSKEN